MSIKTWWDKFKSIEDTAKQVKSKVFTEEFNSWKYEYTCSFATEEETRRSRDGSRHKLILKTLAAFLQERKTVSKVEFEEQLGEFETAAKAVANLEVANISGNSSAGSIVIQNYNKQRAKLLLLAYEDISISAETAAVIFNEMLEQTKEK